MSSQKRYLAGLYKGHCFLQEQEQQRGKVTDSTRCALINTRKTKPSHEVIGSNVLYKIHVDKCYLRGCPWYGWFVGLYTMVTEHIKVREVIWSLKICPTCLFVEVMKILKKHIGRGVSMDQNTWYLQTEMSSACAGKKCVGQGCEFLREKR